MASKLIKLKVNEVSTVDKAANGQSFVVIKSADGESPLIKAVKNLGEALANGSLQTDDVEKALDFNTALQSDILNIVKAGKKISGERMNTLKDLHSQLGSFIDGASDEQPNNEPDEEPADPANNAGASNKNADPANTNPIVAKGSVSNVADKPSFPANHPDGCMCDTCKGVRAAVTKSVETPPVVDVAKSAEYVSLEKRCQTLEEQIQKRDEKDKEIQLRKKFDGLTLAIDLDAQIPVLKGMKDEDIDKYVATLKAADEQVLKGALFSEIGTGGVGESSVEKQLEAKAVEIQKSETSLTYEQSFAKALDRNPKLYEEYMRGEQ